MLKNFPEAKIFDGSKWFKHKGGCAKEYYKYVMAMAICHGVLFDNFLDDHEILPEYGFFIKGAYGHFILRIKILLSISPKEPFARSSHIFLGISWTVFCDTA